MSLFHKLNHSVLVKAELASDVVLNQNKTFNASRKFNCSIKCLYSRLDPWAESDWT